MHEYEELGVYIDGGLRYLSTSCSLVYVVLKKASVEPVSRFPLKLISRWPVEPAGTDLSKRMVTSGFFKSVTTFLTGIFWISLLN